MISVIISTYNRPKKLEKAVNSVLNQTYQDFEIIICDDGSKSETKKLIDSLINKDDRIKSIRLEKNFGNDTRPKNLGILASKGEYIAFLDDDCVYRKDHLSILMAGIENYDVAYGDRWIVDEHTNAPERKGKSLDFNIDVLFQENYIDTSDVLIKKSVLEYVGGFDEEHSKFIDWNLWLRVAKAGYRFKHIPILITDYYICSDSKSQRTAEVLKPTWDPQECLIRRPFLGKVKKPKVGVFSLTYDRLEYTKKCFESLYNTAGYKFDHYIIDNGSLDETHIYLAENFTHIKLNGKNKGISIASNQALEMMKGKYDIIVKIDNDCLFLTEGWMKKMVEIWESNHMIALSPYVQGLIHTPGGSPRLGHGMLKNTLLGFTKHLGGICHFVHSKIYENFRWDETQPLHGVQDLELSQYLIKNGYLCAYLENYFCEHIEGTLGQHKKYPEYFERRKIEKTKTYGSSL